jgi:hypothetical protein
MITYEKLNEQNHRVTELSNILHYLFKDRSMCDTDSCCDLFHNYVDLVKEHVDMVDKELCSELLKSQDEKIDGVAKNFLSGSVEIKKILKDFTKHWCPTKAKGALMIKDHKEFLADTDKLFDLVLRRILDETEHLYPLVRKLG